jgi:hypothetical protein
VNACDNLFLRPVEVAGIIGCLFAVCKVNVRQPFLLPKARSISFRSSNPLLLHPLLKAWSISFRSSNPLSPHSVATAFVSILAVFLRLRTEDYHWHVQLSLPYRAFARSALGVVCSLFFTLCLLGWWWGTVFLFLLCAWRVISLFLFFALSVLSVDRDVSIFVSVTVCRWS